MIDDIKCFHNFLANQKMDTIYKLNDSWWYWISDEEIFTKFLGRVGLVQGTYCNILGMFYFTLCIQEPFSNVGGNPCVLPILPWKQVNKLSWNFQGWLNMRQGTIWNILMILWIQDQFLYFLDLHLIATLWKNGEWIVMKFSGYVGHGTS